MRAHSKSNSWNPKPTSHKRTGHRTYNTYLNACTARRTSKHTHTTWVLEDTHCACWQMWFGAWIMTIRFCLEVCVQHMIWGLCVLSAWVRPSTYPDSCLLSNIIYYYCINIFCSSLPQIYYLKDDSKQKNCHWFVVISCRNVSKKNADKNWFRSRCVASNHWTYCSKYVRTYIRLSYSRYFFHRWTREQACLCRISTRYSFICIYPRCD